MVNVIFLIFSFIIILSLICIVAICYAIEEEDNDKNN